MASRSPLDRRHHDRRKSRSVLVVEDDPDIASLVRLLLEWAGHTVSLAEDIQTARAALAGQRPPDVVVLDLQLPDGDGVDLCREIKTSRSATPVLVVSAGYHRRQAAAACGADGFLGKPFEPDDLEASIRELLGGARVERRVRQRRGGLHTPGPG